MNVKLLSIKYNITQAELMQQLKYEPESGNFIRVKNSTKAKVGDIAGGVSSGDGYVYIRILTPNSTKFLAHRLAWLYMTGEHPKEFIDHKDGNRSNNKWENLREATSIENSRNRKLRNDNNSNLTGVSFNFRLNKWVATCKIPNKKSNHIGVYESKKEAYDAYVEYASKHFKEFYKPQEYIE